MVMDMDMDIMDMDMERGLLILNLDMVMVMDMDMHQLPTVIILAMDTVVTMEKGLLSQVMDTMVMVMVMDMAMVMAMDMAMVMVMDTIMAKGLLNLDMDIMVRAMEIMGMVTDMDMDIMVRLFYKSDVFKSSKNKPKDKCENNY